MKAERIVIHHSGTPDDGQSYSWPAIKRYHIEVNKWADVAYHGGVEVAGGLPMLQLGRLWDSPGAHCLGHNWDSLGFCFVGNFMAHAPSDEFLREGAKLIRFWMRLYGIPVTEIYRHCELNATDCPGALFPMDALKAMLI
jgi:N-acetylmuramoyl-L-alanine amidase